ncbi:MAG: GGDEF domain-containing protein [Baekduiaceae bacterium]
MGGAKIGSIETLRRVSAAGDLIAVVMLLGTTVLPDPDPSDHRSLYFVALAPLTLGLILLFGRRLPERTIKLVAITGTIAAVSLMVSQILPLGAALMFYCWPAVMAGYFCTRREITGNLLLIAGGSAIALAVSRSDEITGSTWLATVIISTIVALTVGRLVEQVTKVATIDELSGLLNRSAFGPILDREFERARTSRQPVSVVIFDLDHFKLVNDRFGHAAGDDAIRLFGALLARETRDVDVAARVGGEEFTVLLFGMDEAAAVRWAEGVSALLIAETLDEEVALSTSAGVACACPATQSPEDLLQAADRALYAAKAGGRRCVVTAGAEAPHLAAVA